MYFRVFHIAQEKCILKYIAVNSFNLFQSKKDASFNEKLFSSLNDTSFFQGLYQT